MTAFPVIEHFDILEDLPPGFVPGGVVLMIHELALERPEEAFDTGIIPAVASTAHAGRDAVRSEQLLVPRGGILTAAVRVMQEPRRGCPVGQRHGESVFGQVQSQAIAHRPANHRT